MAPLEVTSWWLSGRMARRVAGTEHPPERVSAAWADRLRQAARAHGASVGTSERAIQAWVDRQIRPASERSADR
jgi:hypothetical protein